ncbi:MAG: hypothetical protein M3R54_09755 [Chloroflexota bacterium]|nr:hypothetical protein [Chloroflexota bacterium]
MTSHLSTKLGRSAATLVLAILALTDCGTTSGTAVAAANGVGAQGQASTTTTNGLAGGDAYLTADGQYAVGTRTGGAATQANDRAVCAPSGTTCLEP